MRSAEQTHPTMTQRWGVGFLKASTTTREKGLIQRNPDKDLNKLARNVYSAPTSAGDHDVHKHTIDFHLQMMANLTAQETFCLLYPKMSEVLRNIRNSLLTPEGAQHFYNAKSFSKNVQELRVSRGWNRHHGTDRPLGEAMEETKFFWKNTLEISLDIQQQSTATSTSTLFKQVQIGGGMKTARPTSSRLTGAADSHDSSLNRTHLRTTGKKKLLNPGRTTGDSVSTPAASTPVAQPGHLNLATAYTP